MSADGSPIGMLLRCESVAHTFGFGLKLVNTSRSQIVTSASVQWRMTRALTRRGEDPDVVVGNTCTDIAWPQSKIQLRVECAGTLGEMQGDHADADTPWFSVRASMPKTTLEPGASVLIGTELSLIS